MALHLRVVGAYAARLGPQAARAFGVHGGQIGRAPDNDWVLPDDERYVSGYHATVSVQKGRWVVTDRSSNGTFVNGSLRPIPSHQSYPLSDGDTLRIGDYEIQVRITPELDFPPQEGTFAPDGGSDAFAMTHGDIGAELDLPGLIATGPDGDGDKSAPPAADAPAPAEEALSGADVARLLAAGTPAAPAAEGAPRPPATGPRAVDTPPPTSLAPAVTLLLRSAGLDPQQLAGTDPAQVLTVAGQLLREMTLGLGSALRSAQALPDGGSQTAIRRISPLAAADGVNDSLARLLGRRAGRTSGAVDTVRDGFETLHKHDQARQQALADAVSTYAALFAPAALTAQFERVLARSAVAPVDPKAKYWDLYADLYRVLVQPNEDGVPHAFAEQYQQAYQAARHDADPTDATASRRVPGA